MDNELLDKSAKTGSARLLEWIPQLLRVISKSVRSYFILVLPGVTESNEYYV